MEEQYFPCPSCGFLVFGEPPGSYEICELCGWEDDHVQLRYPALSGGANKQCLAQHQQQALTKLPVGAASISGFVRAPGWRPLKPEEVLSPSAPTSGAEYFHAAAADAPPYYWGIT